jgi:HJR/Mrr/RecB family endonuclease
VPVYRGDTLIRKFGPGENDIDRRPIVGVAVFGTILGSALKILAPRRVTPPDPHSPIIHEAVPDSEGKQTLVELRPGTVFFGGRQSGFYDSDGIILEAHHIGGDPERYEDWIYYVIGKSDFGKYAPQWITLADVGGAVASPTAILEFPLDMTKSVEELLTQGESELFAYFVNRPDALTDLSPNNFEQLVGAIYRNLGFSVEHLGAWNQEDGGVDIVAVSKSAAGTEIRLAIQCKTSKNSVSAKPIRELAGVLEAFRAHQGVVATTSRFTSAAETEAFGSLWKISLQDRDKLFKKMVEILVPHLRNRI